MFDRTEFEAFKLRCGLEMGGDEKLQQQALEFVVSAQRYDYAYMRTWLGMPIIQLPEDILITQEIFWADKPDIVIETGIAWGGSVILHASLMELAGNGKVLGIDKVLPVHVRDELMKYPFSRRIHLIEGDSASEEVFEAVKAEIGLADKISVFLDSNHTHEHVLSELRSFGKLVTKGQHLTVYATAIENMPKSTQRPRPWAPGASPMTAIAAYFAETDRFIIDEGFDNTSLVSYVPKGRLLCIK